MKNFYIKQRFIKFQGEKIAYNLLSKVRENE